MTPPENSYQIAGMFLGYFGRFLFFIGVALLLASVLFRTGLWMMGGLLILVSVFMWAIAYALRLPP